MDEKKLENGFRQFVDGLPEEAVREELVLAYLQMERCQQVLMGDDVEPVEMMDNGESSDLELFYRCKKAHAELSLLNEELAKVDDDEEEEEG